MSAGSRLLALAVVLLAAGAHADARWGLTFKAPPECLQPAELAEKVETRLKRPLFGAKVDLRIDGYVKRAESGKGWRARLTLVEADGTVKGARDVSTAEPSCRAIDESLVLVMAVMIDPDALLLAPSEPPPAPAPEPTPPPVVQPPREIPPRTELPRERWPDFLTVDEGRYVQNGRWLDRDAFYRTVGRGDLVSQRTARITSKVLLFVVGSLGLVTASGFAIAYPLNVSCVRYSGVPGNAGSCVERGSWPLVTAAVTAAVSVAMIITGAVLRSLPTTDADDHRLADEYNAKLSPPFSSF